MATPLTVAVKRGYKTTVQTLIDHGANITSWDLYHEAVHGQADMLRFLMDSGASIDMLRKYDQAMLCRAAENGFDSVVRMLAAYGVEVKPCKDMEITMLEAMKKGQAYITRTLVELGAADIQPKKLEKALRKAAAEGKEPVVRNLVRHGVDVNAVCLKTQKTAMSEAKRCERDDIVKLLTELRAKDA